MMRKLGVSNDQIKSQPNQWHFESQRHCGKISTFATCTDTGSQLLRAAFLGRQADQGADLRGGGTWAGRSPGSPAVGQVLRRRLAFFVAPLVTVFLPTVLR